MKRGRNRGNRDKRPRCSMCGHRGFKIVRWSKAHHDGERPVFRCDSCGKEWLNGKGEPYLRHAMNLGILFSSNS